MKARASEDFFGEVAKSHGTTGGKWYEITKIGVINGSVVLYFMNDNDVNDYWFLPCPPGRSAWDSFDEELENELMIQRMK